MVFGHAHLETSCLLLHVLVASTLVELQRAFQLRKPQMWACRLARVLSVGWFRLIQNLDTFLIVFLRGSYSGLGPSEGVIVYGLFCNEALYIGKASVAVPKFGRFGEGRRVGGAGVGSRGSVSGVVRQASPGENPLTVQERWGWTFFFSPLYTAQIREEHAYCGSQGPLCLFDPYRLELFLAYCAKGSSHSNFP